MIYNSCEDLRDLRETVEKTVRALSKHVDEFDSIVVRGMSGVVVGAPVSLEIGKPLVIVRKPGENCHDFQGVVGATQLGRRFIFLDDFVSSGATRRETLYGLAGVGTHGKEQYEMWGREPEPLKAAMVATYMYQHDIYKTVSADEWRVWTAEFESVKSRWCWQEAAA